MLRHYGFRVWEFEGAFGIAGHGRPGAAYAPLHGCNVDTALLDLLRAGRRL
jgi:hypothetical protein